MYYRPQPKPSQLLIAGIQVQNVYTYMFVHLTHAVCKKGDVTFKYEIFLVNS